MNQKDDMLYVWIRNEIFLDGCKVAFIVLIYLIEQRIDITFYYNDDG